MLRSEWYGFLLGRVVCLMSDAYSFKFMSVTPYDACVQIINLMTFVGFVKHE